MIETAKRICKMAHEGQFDKGGNAYYLHPFAVADMCKTENEKIVAYLHDVLEDTEITADDLAAAGFSREVIDALIILTHDPREPYFDYIKRIRENHLARAVKINDLTHNSDLSRLKEITAKDLARIKKYEHSMQILQAE